MAIMQDCKIVIKNAKIFQDIRWNCSNFERMSSEKKNLVRTVESDTRPGRSYSAIVHFLERPELWPLNLNDFDRD